MYVRYVKRGLDFFMAALGLVLLAIPLGIIALCIYLEDGGPVIYRQERVGFHKTPFIIYKFRSMKKNAPNLSAEEFADQKDYVLRSGSFFRKTSLDELPQLWNILKGDMSFIGPRPVIPEDVELVEARDLWGANDVLPGLSGWAQIHGRKLVTAEEKAGLDGYYVQNQGFWMDFKCLFGTLPAVIHQEGAECEVTEKEPRKKSGGGAEEEQNMKAEWSSEQ